MTPQEAAERAAERIWRDSHARPCTESIASYCHWLCRVMRSEFAPLLAAKDAQLESCDKQATAISNAIGVPLDKEHYEILRGGYTVDDVLRAVAEKVRQFVAEKDAEIERLKGDLRHCAESAGTLDSCAAIALENAKLRGLLGERDRLAAEVDSWRRDCADIEEERDRLVVENAELREFLSPDNIRKWWRFDSHQQPMSGWHEREGFIERVAALADRKPDDSE